MQTGELANFRAELLSWFGQFQRNLPWRRTRNPYRIWLSEIMLQQTRVAAVIPYFERFLERFPDIRSLAEAPQQEVLRLWSGLGYYSRARNLQGAAQEIVAKHNGEFPRTPDALRALPGIGSYTAAAILSIAFGEKLAVLDGNVARVLSRLQTVRGDLRQGARWKKLQSIADEFLAPESPGDWNQAMMELGATLCTPKAPQCLLCPVASHCRARKLGLAEELPEKRRKRDGVDVVLVAAVFLNPKGETLLLPPPAKSNGKITDDVPTLVSRMWHFPTRPVKKDPKSELRALLRDHDVEKNRRSPQTAPLAQVRHCVTYRNIRVLPFLVELASLPRAAHAKRIALSQITSLPISSLTRKVARAAFDVAPS